MKIEQIAIADLKAADYNPRKLTEKQFNDIKESLDRFGFVDPVIVNSNPERHNVIIGGHQRVKVWRAMSGNATVPVFYIDLPLEKEKELNIRLNRNTGEFDFELLEINFEQKDLLEWGFDDSEFALKMDTDSLDNDFSLPDGEKPPIAQMTFTLANEQGKIVAEALSEIKKQSEFDYVETFGNENGNGNALYLMVTQWQQAQKK